MTYHRQIVAQIFRFGQKAEVQIQGNTGQNQFGNVTHDYTPDRYVIAFQTFPNRNTDIETNTGERSRNRPVFLVPNTDDQPAPPAEGDRLVYDGQAYEANAHTRYDTHVEFFGEPVIN